MRRRLLLEELTARIVPTYLGNQVFPLDNPWNQDISSAPVAGNSGAIINAIVARHNGTAPKVHADWGNPNDGNLYGIPVNVVNGSTPKVSVVVPNFGYGDESDLVDVPIPANAVIEGDGANGPADPSDRGDSHLLVYDQTNNLLYELYQAIRPNETDFPYGGTKPTGQWGAYQISFWDLNDNSFRTIGATSADAAGLPILPGLVRPDEVNPVSAGGVGVIDHAIRMTLHDTRDQFVFPASHEASNLTANNLARMGERFRLKSTVTIPTTWSPEAKAIAQAMKTYGLIVADNGSDMYFTGAPSTQWDMGEVLDIQALKATDFEVVDLAPRVTSLSVNSGPTTGGRSVTITGQNFTGAAGELHVLFGNVEAASVTVVSSTQIVAVSPAHVAGTVDVLVRSGTNRTNTDGNSVFFGYGTSATSSATKFTFGTGPTAGNDSYTVLHDRTLSVGAIAAGVLGNDTPGVAGHTLTAILASGPTHGSVTLNSNGTFTYKPTAGYSGSDSFTYFAKEGLIASEPATVSIAVTDQAPVAGNDAFKTAKGVKLTVSTNGILKNDTDPDADPMTAVLVTGPAHGTLTLNPSGTFVYTPAVGFSGTDSFTYKANDKALNSAAATVSIDVPVPPSVESVAINDGSVQRSIVRSITVKFDTLVTLDAGAFRVRSSGGTIPGLSQSVSTVNGKTQVVLTFKGTGTYAGSLADSRWTLYVFQTRVHRADFRPAVMAANSTIAFHRFFGDSDGDRDTDSTDQSAFNSAFGQTDATSLAVFDFDHDGDIDSTDQLQFNRRLGRSI